MSPKSNKIEPKLLAVASKIMASGESFPNAFLMRPSCSDLLSRKAVLPLAGLKDKGFLKLTEWK